MKNIVIKILISSADENFNYSIANRSKKKISIQACHASFLEVIGEIKSPSRNVGNQDGNIQSAKFLMFANTS